MSLPLKLKMQKGAKEWNLSFSETAGQSQFGLIEVDETLLAELLSGKTVC